MHLESLTPLFARSGPWATAYAGTAQATESAGTERRLTARDAGETLIGQGADSRTARAVTERLEAFRPQDEPHGRAVFANRGEVVLDLPLTQPPQQTLTSYSVLPHLAPLPELMREDPLCLTVRIDRTGADMELRDSQGVRPAGQALGSDYPVHRTATGDMSERHFELRVEETWESNAGLIADAVAERFAATGADVLVLCGDARERRAVHDRLPPALREAAVETRHGGRAAGSDSELLDEATEQARADYAQRHTAEALDGLRAGHAPGAPGLSAGTAEDVPDLVEAAREHRIGTLLMGPGGTDRGREVWVGENPDQLGVRRSELRYLGASDPAPARADDALLRSAAATDAEVLVTDGERDVPVGGMGALLRWTNDPGGAPLS
ncbi:Vms1/Ankzf1 family peptidyl-tRNA hydrolase [Streptomyces sp. NRRL F-5053]|uniref:baeRF2 domain-containing protein n=1 Tax=Streptomyces sp. NRRL F-5053 TaxID=1463854 RepID=UPI0004C7CAFD|nr:Vms1/Ankzf1 family peptidyl-tRNA hydrolase [Streptomyces sp. NRRL F-5053]